MSKVIILCFTLAICFSLVLSCGDRTHDAAESPVVASSGKAKLRLNEINSFVIENPSLELSKIQVQNYIQRWSEKELIYQHAISEQFDAHPDMQKKLYELKKDFIVAAYLHEQIDNKLTVSESEIVSYYNEKASEFIRQEDFYNIQLLLVASSNEAYQIRRRLLDGEDFETLAKENSLDASKENGGKLGWIKPNTLPDRVVRRLPSLALNTVSTPISTSVGHYLILVTGVREKGKVQTLEEVRDIIEWRIRARSREENYEALLNRLKEKDRIEIDWSYLDSLNMEQ